MPAIENLLSQFNKREQKENQGMDNSDDRSPAVIVGLVIAALTLLLVIMSYRHSRLGSSASPSSPSHSLNACLAPSSLSLITLRCSQTHNPLQQAPRTPLPNHSTTLSPADPARVNHVFIYNDYSNAPFASASLHLLIPE